MANKQTGTALGESFVRRHRNFAVGIFILIPLAVVPALLIYAIMKLEWWQDRDQVYVVYDQSYGLSTSNAVTYAGINIGRVGKVTLAGKGRTVVRLEINALYTPLLKKDAKAFLGQRNMVGDWEIAIKGGTDAAGSVGKDDTLAAGYTPRLDILVEQLSGMVNNVDSIIKHIASGKGSVGKIIKEDTLVNQVSSILRDVGVLTRQSAGMMEKANALLDNLNKAGASGAAIAQSSVGLVDTVKTILSTVQTALRDVPAIMRNVHEATGSLPPLMTQVQSELDQADVLLRGLQNNWLVRQAIGKPKDEMLKNDP